LAKLGGGGRVPLSSQQVGGGFLSSFPVPEKRGEEKKKKPSLLLDHQDTKGVESPFLQRESREGEKKKGESSPSNLPPAGRRDQRTGLPCQEGETGGEKTFL